MDFRWIILVACSLCVVTGNFDPHDEEYEDQKHELDQNVAVVPLEHSISTLGEFTVRGKLTYRGPKSVASKSRRRVSVHVEQSRLSREDLKNLQGLLDAGQLYRVRIQSNVHDPNSPKVMASLPACLLVASNFHEIFRIHVDQHGNIRSLWYHAAASHCTSGSQVPYGDSVQLTTSISVDMDTKGPKLPIEPVVRVEREGADAPKEPEAPSMFSFFRKYWIYILGGMLLLQMFSGEDAAGDRAGAAGAASAGRAGAAGPRVASGGRGK